MKGVFKTLVLSGVIIAQSVFGQVSKPDEPDVKSHRKEMQAKLGVKSFAVGLSATSVVDLKEFGIAVLYGAIFLKLDRSAIYIFENKEAGLLCRGRSAKGINKTQCFYKGEQVTNTTIPVDKSIYKTPEGFNVSPIETVDGRSFGNSYTKWGLFSFPDPTELITNLQNSSN